MLSFRTLYDKFHSRFSSLSYLAHLSDADLYASYSQALAQIVEKGLRNFNSTDREAYVRLKLRVISEKLGDEDLGSFVHNLRDILDNKFEDNITLPESQHETDSYIMPPRE